MRSLLHGLGGAVIGGAGTLAVLKFVPWPGLEMSPSGIVIGVVCLPVIFLLIVACHEGGHLLAAALARFKPCLLIVGPLKLERSSLGWRVGWNKVFPRAGGLVAATPEGLHRLRERMAVLVAGGPSMSMLAGITALAFLAIRGDPAQATLAGAPALVFVLTFAFGLGSLMVGLLALVPGQGHGFSTDGTRILRFLSHTPGVDAEVALLGLIGMSMSGRRPREWDAELIGRALQLPADTPYGAAARMMAHSHALDREDELAAREHLRVALQHIEALPLMSRPALLLQAAYFAAAHDLDAAAARRYLSQAGHGALVSPHSRPLAEAAVLTAEADPRAPDLLAAAACETRHAIDRGAAALAEDQIARLRRRLALAPDVVSAGEREPGP
jgi:hypothetical protein